MSKKRKSKSKHAITVTDQDLANARLALAYTVLDSDNGAEIIEALHHLTMTAAKRAAQERKHGSKRKAKQWKHSADEFFTVMMCAVYTKQDQETD